MPAPILVTYATRYGATQEVATVVTATLREQGLEVDLEAMPQVPSLEGYRMIVFGAPLYIGHWHKDAHSFLAKHREALMQRQVAVFTLGPIRPDESEWKDVSTQLERELAEHSWLKPVASELFGGNYDPAKLRFPDSLLAKLPVSPLHGMPASDARDRQAIRAWAAHLATVIQPVVTPST